jgi:acyl-CoA reductase-like NAD-dependent aldehyde dehydrogenase
MATHDVHWGVDWLRDVCALTLPEKVIESAPERQVVERYMPIGVGVGIVPWNGPVILVDALKLRSFLFNLMASMQAQMYNSILESR